MPADPNVLAGRRSLCTVQFLALRDEITDLARKGYNRSSVYAILTTQDKLRMSYSQFCRLLNGKPTKKNKISSPLGPSLPPGLRERHALPQHTPPPLPPEVTGHIDLKHDSTPDADEYLRGKNAETPAPNN